jgi:hypothetical protein
MLISTKELCGRTLGALDGDVGRIEHLFIDDATWQVRYLEVQTGSWLDGRRVLLSLDALARVDSDPPGWEVNLQRRQIEGCPSSDPQSSGSRRCAAEYRRISGWPTYWNGGELWGTRASALGPRSFAADSDGRKDQPAAGLVAAAEPLINDFTD